MKFHAPRALFLLSTLVFAFSGRTEEFSGPRLVDLSKETQRQVVVDREDGQYLGHPTTLLLDDNKTVLCVYPKGHGKGAIIYKRSDDGGLQWSERLETPANWATSLETPTLHKVTTAEGKTRLLLFSGLYPIRMSHSEDFGTTWTPLEPIGNFGGIVAMASLTQLKDGSVLAFFHDDGRFLREGIQPKDPRVFVVYMVRSTDFGLTWSQPEPVTMKPDAQLCEPGLVYSPDHNEMALLLREDSRKFNSFVVFSRSEALSWTQPRELPPALTGDRHTARYAPDGRLLVSFRDMYRDSPTYGDWLACVGTYQDIVDGKPGQYRVRIMDNTGGTDCAYPGVEVFPDGTFLLTTYGHWTEGEPPYIVSVRLTLQELDERAK